MTPAQTPPVNCCGALVTPKHILVTSKTTGSAGNVIDPWNAPLLLPTSGSQLATALTKGVDIPATNPNNPGNVTYTSQDLAVGPRSINFYGLYYYISYGSASATVADTEGNYWMRPLSLVTYNQNTGAFNILTNAPHGAFDLIGYQSRIWLLGGIDTPGSGTTHDGTALFFTNPVVAGGGAAAADWKDPVAGTTNVIHMDGDAADYGVGLATVRNALVILRRSSVYVLKGTTTANYMLLPISKEVGCMDARSIVETDHGAYFISREGLMLTNGVSIVNVSGSILYTLQTAIRAEQAAVMAGNNGYITCEITSQGQILVSIGTGSPSSGSYSPIFTALFDPAAIKGGAWVRITSQLWASDGNQQTNNYAGQLYGHNAPHHVMAIGDKYVTAFEDELAGISFLEPRFGLYDQLPSGTNPYVSIPAVWKTAFAPVVNSAKRQIGQAHRYYVDYNFAAQNLIPVTGWTSVPVDATGAQMDTPQALPVGAAPTLTGVVSGITPSPSSLILRFGRDWLSEITQDAYFTVSWSDTARASQANAAVAEIYGVGIEYQGTRPARTSGPTGS